MKHALNYPANLPQRAYTEPSLAAIEHVCKRLRPDEIEQYMKLAAPGKGEEEFSARTAALGFANINGPSICLLDRSGMPCALGGYGMDPFMPGVWQSWMAGTPEAWRDEWRDITKGVRWLICQLMDGGARRLETNVTASRVDAQRWYTDFLGMKPEGERRGYTLDGESLLLYSITREDWNGRWE